ncbi:hypothetical protein JCM3770_005945 [Rhodotorula araucariae]
MDAKNVAVLSNNASICEQLLDPHTFVAFALVVPRTLRFLLVEAQVSPLGGTMSYDRTFHTRTHLAAVLKPGGTVRGYLVANSNYNNDAFETLNRTAFSRRFSAARRCGTARSRATGSSARWSSKVGGKWVEDTNTVGLGHQKAEQKPKQARASDQATAGADYVRFLQDLDEDEELRQPVQPFEDATAVRAQQGAMADDDTDAANDDEEFPAIKVNELLAEFDALALEHEDMAPAAEAEAE